MIRILPCGAEQAADVHRLTQAAFSGYGTLDPPSGATRESVERVANDLAAGGGAIAELDGRRVGCLRWWIDDEQTFRARRVAVDPELHRSGIGCALMAWAEEEARRRGCPAIAVGVRLSLPGNLAFYRSLGYDVVGERSHDGYDRPTWLLLRKLL